VAPDKVVKTHCCFCGQQCGIQLLVKDNQVIGFEPWMDFPFNTGKLCPKGVKRYLQGAHRDRLLHAYERDETAPDGFKPIEYGRAIARVAGEIGRIQSQAGRDASSILAERLEIAGGDWVVIGHQRRTIVNGILSVVSILVVLQLWLLTATMNAYLGADDSILTPAALASIVCLLLNFGLLRYIYRLESR
jgi:predicted molibdopterin-dependent oxidoreductase YjgC